MQTVLYVDSRGAIFPHRATVSICGSVSAAKGDDFKQIVQRPALSLSVSAGFSATLRIIYNSANKNAIAMA